MKNDKEKCVSKGVSMPLWMHDEIQSTRGDRTFSKAVVDRLLLLDELKKKVATFSIDT